MFTLRCTRKLLTRLRMPPAPETVEPTTRLGDWYANVLFRPGGQLLLLVNERSLLPVLLPAAPMSTVLARLQPAVAAVLTRLGVPPPVVKAELRQMADVRLGITASRRVLGSMNDFANMLDAYRHDTMALADISLELALAPCGPIGWRSPNVVAAELLVASK